LQSVASFIPDAFKPDVSNLLGIKQYYRVSLWGYCSQAFDSTSVTCTSPTPRFFFDSVSAISSDLVHTNDLRLPTQLINELSEAKSATNGMFVLFILGEVLLFLGIFLGIITAVSTLRPTLMFFLSLLTVLVVFVATILATVVYQVEATKTRNAYADDGLSVNTSLGAKAVALVWLGTVFAAAAAVGWTCVYIFWRRGRHESRQSKPWWRFHRSVNEPVITGPIIPRRQ